MVKRLEKEYNPALQFDAFTAGIEDGGLRSSSSIAILACYIIARSKEKLTAKNVVDALVEGKIANYFEISSAISKMIKTNNLVENEDGHLSITEKCAFNVEMLENDLPITIREKAVELAAKTARLELYKKKIKQLLKKTVTDIKLRFMSAIKIVTLWSSAYTSRLKHKHRLLKKNFKHTPAKCMKT